MTEDAEFTDEPTLTLIVNNREPIGLGQVASILESIAKDYGQMTGRELSLRSARQGSFIATLVDTGAIILGAMGAVVTIRDFTKLIRDLISRSKEEGIALLSARSNGVKTVRALMKTSRSSHADLDLVYEYRDERVVARMTRNDAEQIHLRSHELRSRPALPQPNTRAVEFDPADRAIEEFARAAAAVSDDPNTLDQEGNPAFALAKVLVRELRDRPGGRDRLRGISRSLQSQSQAGAARLLDALVNS